MTNVFIDQKSILISPRTSQRPVRTDQDYAKINDNLARKKSRI